MTVAGLNFKNEQVTLKTKIENNGKSLVKNKVNKLLIRPGLTIFFLIIFTLHC